MTLQAHVSEAFAECNETRRLLIEWRDANDAVDATPPMRLTDPEVVDRFMRAEEALLAYARQYKPRHEEPK